MHSTLRIDNLKKAITCDTQRGDSYVRMRRHAWDEAWPLAAPPWGATAAPYLMESMSRQTDLHLEQRWHEP